MPYGTREILENIEDLQTTQEGSVNAEESGVIETGLIVKDARYPVYQFLEFTPDHVSLEVEAVYNSRTGEWHSPGATVNATASHSILGVSGFRFIVSRSAGDSSIDFRARIRWTATGISTRSSVKPISLGGHTWTYALPTSRSTTRTYSPTSWLNERLAELNLENARNFTIGETTGFSINSSNGTLTGNRIDDDIGTLPLRLHISLAVDRVDTSPAEIASLYFYVDVEYTQSEAIALTWRYPAGLTRNLVLTEQTALQGWVISSLAVTPNNAVFAQEDGVLFYNGLTPPSSVEATITATRLGVMINATLTITMTAFTENNTLTTLYYTGWHIDYRQPSSLTLETAMSALGYELTEIQAGPTPTLLSTAPVTYNAITQTLSYANRSRGYIEGTYLNGSPRVFAYATSGTGAPYFLFTVSGVKDDTHYTNLRLNVHASIVAAYATTWDVDNTPTLYSPDTTRFSYRNSSFQVRTTTKVYGFIGKVKSGTIPTGVLYGTAPTYESSAPWSADEGLNLRISNNPARYFRQDGNNIPSGTHTFVLEGYFNDLPDDIPVNNPGLTIRAQRAWRAGVWTITLVKA